mmetsp:Transcript_29247/g.42421  ORF Transcript_29247/g.42421 Transcript_29247/m.42421 type:complete len:116 (+) Transcript_29247:53-400(+)
MHAGLERHVRHMYTMHHNKRHFSPFIQSIQSHVRSNIPRHERPSYTKLPKKNKTAILAISMACFVTPSLEPSVAQTPNDPFTTRVPPKRAKIKRLIPVDANSAMLPPSLSVAAIT